MNEFDWEDCDTSPIPSPLKQRRRRLTTPIPPSKDVLKIIHKYPALRSPRDFHRSRFSSKTTSFTSRVSSILSTSPTDRSLDDYTFLRIFSKRCDLFSHLNDDEVDVLMQSADLQSYQKGDRVFTAGDPCTATDPNPYTYVILEGTVSVCAQNNHDISTTAISEYLHHDTSYIEAISSTYLIKGEYTISNMGTTCSFGARAATCGTRTVSVLCSNSSQMMRIPAVAFSEAVERHRNNIGQEVQQCLLNAHCLQQLSKQDIVLLAKHAKIQNYPRNSIVFRQGAPCVGVAVVLTGGFRILQKRDTKIVDVARLAKGELWGYKPLLRVVKKEKKKYKKKTGKCHWRRLSSAVQCSYSTSMVSHERETESSVVWISSHDWSHVVLKNPKIKSLLHYSVALDVKNAGMEDTKMNKELKVTHHIQATASNHVTVHAKDYRKKEKLSESTKQQWWRHENAQEKINQHIAAIKKKSRTDLNLPMEAKWVVDKKIAKEKNIVDQMF